MNCNFVRKNSECMPPDLLQTVNMSLLAGILPQAMKTAVIKPLLKKNLDTSVMNNYRPISNLPILSKITEMKLLHNKWLF